MTPATAPIPRLDDRYSAERGRALMNGIQALVRLLIEQRRLDASRGLNTGVFVSGYPGSPLGGLDREIVRAREHLNPHGVVFEPGVNEELAATAVNGTQLVEQLPGRTRDGVTGFWYGKAPGLDRAADAIRHGNVSGTSHLGGAVALIGDDPVCKSSTLPSSCELMAESLMLPLLSPGGVSDIVRLGLHAVALSRAAGLWTAMKVVSDVADGAESVALDDLAAGIPPPPASSRGAPPMLLGASSVAAEHDLMGARLDAAREYGRAHRLNRIEFEPREPRRAVVAPGPAFATLRRALSQLGVGEPELEELGLRLVRLELVWPLHGDDVRAFADGVQELIVVEDKRPFVERQLRDLLYGTLGAPAVLGKRDGDGRALIELAGTVDADAVARALARHWESELPDAARVRVKASSVRIRQAAVIPLPMARTPFFCSGCPHNLSTRAAEGQLVGVGIGCHALILVDSSQQRGQLLGSPQMGGEGAQWNGMAPFTTDRHYVQNIGDGTFHHSGSLAIRGAVAAGVNITFRLLYNDAIAMTGGQAATGRLGPVELTHWLATEGVKRVIVTTEDPGELAGATLPPIATVYHRDRLAEAQAELATVDGVTVLLHTDRCATEERRLRKRGKLPTPAHRAWINERVCEGCGDCGRKSTCLSVIPVDTELGRKTRIHQSSCTQDMACLEGDCPSFVLVTPAGGARPRSSPPSPPAAISLGEPAPAFSDRATVVIRMPGIGGTGVVTVSQVLQMAAVVDGRWSAGLDQTGLAQKGGPVVSDVRIGPEPQAGAPRAAGGEVDVLLGLDLLGTVALETLRTLDPQRTIAVVNLHETATSAMVSDTDAAFPPLQEIVAQIESATRADRALFLDAGRIAEALFGDHMPANVIMLGAAYQHGCLPVSASAIERALQLNGAAVDVNLAAFAWGRAAAADPEAVAAAIGSLRSATAMGQSTLDAVPPAAVRRRLDGTPVPGHLRGVLERRAADLSGYQDTAYALRYVDDVLAVLAVEREHGGGGTAVTEAYAAAMHKLMAYKDEYEVARLHLDAFEGARLDDAFGSDAEVQILLHPPALRALGLKRKLRLGSSARPLLASLRAGRRLRGTALDPFGRTAIRRLERDLIDEHRTLVRSALRWLTPGTQEDVAALAALPDLIRGYEQIKLANVERYRTAAAESMAALAASPAEVSLTP
ncbi:MAG TPA: indolepyruvate ferredoxin oxidoreductase family protein [Solirubrobacteraceae bacterium]|nr:indolepyruvate ferredoxin oxidoreductase family protein [Solirubrobacteraceae bacterium]